MKFNVPKSPKRDVLIIDEFLGVDFTNSPANIDDNKSPNAVNMIRDVPGHFLTQLLSSFSISCLIK